MKIALLGYGKMGHEIEAAALQAGHSIAATFDDTGGTSAAADATLDGLRDSGADVAIDFSQANAVETNVSLCAEAGIPIVIGTTGWESSLDAVRKMVDDGGIGCVVGSNFSIGVNLFLEIVRTASRLVSAADYDGYIIEEHHRTKKDFPSGTALRISEVMLAGLKSKTKIASALKQGEGVAPDTILISSVRAGAITGMHTVGFDSDVDSIELTHRAKSRRGFAIGAIDAAEWIVGRKGFYRFEEHINEILERENNDK